MSTITTINGGDQITNSRAVINTNFSNLNTDKIETSVIDTDTTMAANSDAKIPSQKAVKAYIDSGPTGNSSTSQKGVVEEATQAEIEAGTATGGTGARLFVGTTNVSSRHPRTSAFNTTAPTSYTDLDLSSIVGARRCTVLLKVNNKDTSNDRYYAFRRNGETLEPNDGATTALGTSKTGLVPGAGGNKYALVLVTTDATGIVEWLASGASSTEVTVESFW
jgi:hypothetical protein